MKKTVIIITLLLLSYWPSSLQAASPQLILTDQQGQYPLGLHLEYLADPTGKLTLAEVMAEEVQFVASRQEILNFGLTQDVYWVRFTIRNESSQTTDWLLEFGSPFLDSIDVYLLPSQTHHHFGDLQPFAQRGFNHRHFLLPLSLPQHREQTIYVRYQDKDPDIILMDLVMPTMTGFEAVQQLRQRVQFAHTPIIAVSASIFEQDKERSRVLGL